MNLASEMIVIKNMGLDVDGVLADLQIYQLEKGLKYFCKKFNVSEEDAIKEISSYDVENIFGCTRDERMKFWALYIWEYCLLIPARKDASFYTHKWHDEGRRIDIITSRVYVMQDDFLGALFRLMIKIWLYKENIYYDSMRFCHEKESAVEKSEACKELQIDLMVEDKCDNVEEIKNNSIVACFDANWNKDYQSDGVHRVDSFEEIDHLINRLERFKKLGSKTFKNLSLDEKISYYESMRNHYLSLPYNQQYREKKYENYKKAANLIIPAFEFLYKPQMVGNTDEIQRINGRGVIYVSNHLNSLDQFPIISAIGKEKPLTVLAKNSLLKLQRGKLYSYVGCEFIDLNSLRNSLKVMDELKKIILHGGDILIFPEGTRNTSEKYMLDFSSGAVSLAQETGTKIIPYAVNEDYKILKNSHLYVRRGNDIIVPEDADLDTANLQLETEIKSLIWYNMELEKSSRNCDLREEAISTFQKKKQKIENQRKNKLEK